MTPALLATLVATLAQTTAPVVPGFGTPWFVTARQQNPTTPFKISDRSPGPIPTCTMRTIVAPRDLDPKIVVEPPANVRHSVRRIQPSCR